jgi:hypothetical protein
MQRVRVTEMKDAHVTNVESKSEPTVDKFYLPATTLPTDIGRIEAVLTNLFGGHGRVLIPRTYNR